MTLSQRSSCKIIEPLQDELRDLLRRPWWVTMSAGCSVVRTPQTWPPGWRLPRWSGEPRLIQ